jgi:hypothetical protein
MLIYNAFINFLYFTSFKIFSYYCNSTVHHMCYNIVFLVDKILIQLCEFSIIRTLYH